MFKIRPLAIFSELFDCDTWAPGLCSVSAGGSSGGGSKNVSKTRYPTNFLRAFYNDFPVVQYSNEQDGARVDNITDPAWLRDSDTPEGGGNRAAKGTILPEGFPRQQFTLGIPKFQGLENMDFENLQTNLYNRQLQNLTPTYETERARRREELSQTGLLNSPVAFAEGGALDALERNYLDQSQKAASDAAIQTVGLKQQELARKLGFDMDLVKLIETILQNRAAVALDAGRIGKGKTEGQTSGSFGFSL